MASPTVVGTPVSGAVSSAASLTVSITVPATGSNQVLIVVASASGGNNAAFDGTGSVKYNGTSMTKIANGTASQLMAGLMYYLAAPTQTTANIVLTMDGAVGAKDIQMTAFVLQDCVQASGSVVDGTLGNQSSAGTTSSSISYTTSVNNSAIIGWQGVGTGSTSLVAGQTLIKSSTPGVASIALTGVELFAQTTAGTQSMTWSWTTSHEMEAWAIGLKYVAPPSTVSPHLLSLMGVGS